jgi:hypothetical protein
MDQSIQSALAHQQHPKNESIKTAEGKLVCSILLTYFEDMNYWILRELRAAGKRTRITKRAYKKGTGANAAKYELAKARYDFKVEKRTLINFASARWTRALCELIQLDHGAFISRLKSMNDNQSVVKLHGQGKQPADRYFLEELL